MLGIRLTRADGELTKLRSLLGSLHERARVARLATHGGTPGSPVDPLLVRRKP